MNCRPILSAPGPYERARINDRLKKRRARAARYFDRASIPIYCHGMEARVYEGVCLRCGQKVRL